MPWKSMRLRGNKVFARIDATGALVAGSDGRVEVRYRRVAARAYHATPGNLQPDGDEVAYGDEHCTLEAPPPASADGEVSGKQAVGASAKGDSKTNDRAAGSPVRKKTRSVEKRSENPGAVSRGSAKVQFYTDGACSGNPGPAGLGVYMLDGDRTRSVGEYLGIATNNIAELTAIQRALEMLGERREPAVVFTDSKYAIGVLTQNWKAKANQALIAKIREAVAAHPWVRFEYVPGHAGVAGNERADLLARTAIERRRSFEES